MQHHASQRGQMGQDNITPFDITGGNCWDGSIDGRLIAFGWLICIHLILKLMTIWYSALLNVLFSVIVFLKWQSVFDPTSWFMFCRKHSLKIVQHVTAKASTKILWELDASRSKQESLTEFFCSHQVHVKKWVCWIRHSPSVVNQSHLWFCIQLCTRKHFFVFQGGFVWTEMIPAEASLKTSKLTLTDKADFSSLFLFSKQTPHQPTQISLIDKQICFLKMILFLRFPGSFKFEK